MKISTHVLISMNVTRVLMAVIIYVLTPQDHFTVHVDLAIESSMAYIVKTLTNVPLNKKILRPVGELNTFIDIFKLNKVSPNKQSVYVLNWLC